MEMLLLDSCEYDDVCNFLLSLSSVLIRVTYDVEEITCKVITFSLNSSLLLCKDYPLAKQNLTNFSTN